MGMMHTLGPFSFCGTQALTFLPSENTVTPNLAVTIRNLQVFRGALRVVHVALRIAKLFPKRSYPWFLGGNPQRDNWLVIYAHLLGRHPYRRSHPIRAGSSKLVPDLSCHISVVRVVTFERIFLGFLFETQDRACAITDTSCWIWI